MSAARLREAEKVLRERAEAATPGPWEAYARYSPLCGAIFGVHNLVDDLTDVDVVESQEVTAVDAAYIATMHPGVGLALADWLEAIGAYWALVEESGEPARDADGWEVSFDEMLDSHALRLADLILGEEVAR